MALNFKTGWDIALTKYVNKYGQYQAFLDTLTPLLIEQAFSDANSHFADPAAADFIRTVVASSTEAYTIEQGSHQVEDLPNGGFCLHFTGRNSANVAFHFYIVQNLDGTPKIIKITYFDKKSKKLVTSERA